LERQQIDQFAAVAGIEATIPATALLQAGEPGYCKITEIYMQNMTPNLTKQIRDFKTLPSTG